MYKTRFGTLLASCTLPARRLFTRPFPFLSWLKARDALRCPLRMHRQIRPLLSLEPRTKKDWRRRWETVIAKRAHNLVRAYARSVFSGVSRTCTT